MELSLMTFYSSCSITSHVYVSMKKREGGREGGWKEDKEGWKAM